MRDRIKERLAEYREEALHNIGVAVTQTKSKAAGSGNLHSSRLYLVINKDNEAGFAEYMDQSADFIRHVAPGSWAEYADELRDGGQKLKQEIMAKMGQAPGAAIWVELKGQLDQALDKLIKRKVENFELGYVEGQEMGATTNNTVNIINSNISNSVVEITQSGKDAISKDTALKLQELVNSEEIKALPENDRLHVLDQVDDLMKELKASTTDKGKVHRALNRLGSFFSSVGSKVMEQSATQAAIAYARATGIIP